MAKSLAKDLASLLRASSIIDHEEVLAAAIAASKKSPQDLVTRQTQVVALLKLDRFADALAVLSEGGDALERHCVLEKAYALYKTGQLEGATTWLLSVGSSQATEPGLVHVSAQIAYRAERHADALDAYQRLIPRTDAVADRNDLNINLEATMAQLFWKREGRSTDFQLSLAAQTGSFESCYNMACHCAARGELDTALTHVQRASELCDAAENLSDEDRQVEKRPIELQKAYLLSCLGRPEQAVEILSSIQASQEKSANMDEPAILARNNLSAMTADRQNRFKLHGFLPDSVMAKASPNLSAYQRELVERNMLVADLIAQKCNGVKSRTRRKLKAVEHPVLLPDSVHAAVLNVAAAGQGVLQGRAGLQKTLLAHRQRPDDMGILLAAAQLYADADNYDGAIRILQAFLRRQEQSKTERGRSARFSPGLVALAARLYREKGREASLRSELVRAILCWTAEHGKVAPQLLEKAGIELLASPVASHMEVAGTAFERLCSDGSQSQPSSTAARAGLVASFATRDFSKVQPYLDSLPSVSGLISQATDDVEQLLHTGVAPILGASRSGMLSAKQPLKRPSGLAGQPQPPAKKRRRRARPKSFDPDKTPDPERWLPIRDRTSHRPKGKKGKKKAAEATQGGPVANEETIELVGGAGAVKVERAPVSGPGKKKKRAKK